MYYHRKEAHDILLTEGEKKKVGHKECTERKRRFQKDVRQNINSG